MVIDEGEMKEKKGSEWEHRPCSKTNRIGERGRAFSSTTRLYTVNAIRSPVIFGKSYPKQI